MCIFKLELFENADLHTSQVYGYSPVCVRIGDFKSEHVENADPQTLQDSLQYVSACVFLNYNSVKMLFHTLHKRRVFLSCVFANVLSVLNLLKILIHIPYKTIAPFQHEFACIFLNWTSVKMLIYIQYKNMVFLQCVFASVELDVNSAKILFHILYMNKVSLQCVQRYLLKCELCENADPHILQV